MIRESAGDRAVRATAAAMLAMLTVLILLPMMNVFAKAVSESWAVNAGRVGLLPIGFQIDALAAVTSSLQFLRSFQVSVFLVVVGSALSMVLTALAAYALSKKHLPAIKAVLMIYIFAMVFDGGIIPNYLLIRKLGLLNRVWALILPQMISVFNVLVLKSFFEALPESLEESARLDGASNLRVLFQIVFPAAMPAIATITLFYAVGYWNSFFEALMYVTRPDLKPLQLFLRDVVLSAVDPVAGQRGADEQMDLATESVRAATVVAAIVPMLLVYPWLQRYFVRGILIGSVKG